jgi:hypothetical protein
MSKRQKYFGNQEKSVANLQNQFLKSGEFRSGEKFKNQETPDKIRRFGNPGEEETIMYKVFRNCILSGSPKIG